MVLAPADFYAYSRATGVPVPEDPEERADMVPDVLEFRRNQLQAPRQESNLLQNLGLAGIGLGVAGAGAIGLRSLLGRKPAPVTVSPVKSSPQALENVRRVAEAQLTPPPSKIATPPAAIPQATVDLSTISPRGRVVRRHGRLVSPESLQRAPVAPLTARTFEDVVRTFPSQNITIGEDLDEGTYILHETAKQRFGINSPRAQSLLQAAGTSAEELQPLWHERLRKNHPIWDEIFQQREQLTAIPQATVDLNPEPVREPPTPVEGIGPHTVLPTRAVQPGAFTDLTSIQESLLNQARNQTINAVEAGEDQVTQRARRKTTSLLRGPQAKTSPALQKLYDAGLDDFEINARINAFAQYGKPEFLDLDYNAATVGPENFARTLEVDAPKFDNSGRLVGGRYAAGERTVRVSGEEYAVLPEGELKRSAFASQQPRPVRTRSSTDEESWEPISEALTGLTGGVSTAAPPIMQSEQYEQAINNFRTHWDEQVQRHLAGEQTTITRPARRNRVVDAFDLDLPVTIRTVEGMNETGDVVLKQQKILYRDILPPDQVAEIERGVPLNLDVPFQVDKNRAIAIADANPTVENRLDAEHYRMTGRALTKAHAEIVGPYAGEQFIPDVRESSYYQQVENPAGLPDVTPESGRGSQKGRLVGGTAEPPMREPVYPLFYAQHKTTAGKQMLVNKANVVDQAGNFVDIGVTTLKQLNQLGVAKDNTGAELYISPGQQLDYITTQPMAVKHPLRDAKIVGTVTRQGKYGQFTNNVYEAAETIVQAPLQVHDAETGEALGTAAQIKRDEFAGFLNNLRFATGVTDYEKLGALANQQLAAQRGVTLPVLESPTAFEFIEGVVGRPGSRLSRKSFVTVNKKTGDVYPLSREEAQSLGFAGGSVVDPSQGRKYVGPPSLDIRESPKSEESWARLGEGEADWEQLKDFAEEGLGVASMGGLHPRQVGELQRSLAPATTGPGAEMQSLREQLATIKPKEIVFSQEKLPSNLEVVTKQLMAQAGRRAGKRRIR